MSERPKPKTCDTQKQPVIVSAVKRLGLRENLSCKPRCLLLNSWFEWGNLHRKPSLFTVPRLTAQVADLKLKSMEKMFTSTWLPETD